MPAVFAVVTLSLPVQIMVSNRVSEPFPGLFFPAFRSVPELSDGRLSFSEASFIVDGTTTIDGKTLFGIPEINRVRRLSKRYFPRDPDHRIELSPAMRASLVGNISRATGKAPHVLTVVWKDRRYDTATGKVANLHTDRPYDVRLESP